MFRAGVSGRKNELTPDGLATLNQKLGGHPLAIKLLAPLFESGEGRTLEEFTAGLDEFLPQAADAWDEGRRHDTLRACFDFSLGHLAKSDPTLVQALARLSIFSAAFTDWLAARVIFGIEIGTGSDDDWQKGIERSGQVLHRLWERSLLEWENLPVSREDDLNFYNLHPALRPFANARLDEQAKQEASEGFFLSMRQLASLCYPGREGGGIYGKNAWLVPLASRSLPDLRRASELRADAEGSSLCFQAAFLLTHFGDLDGAMSLYQQSLEIKEGLGDLRGKSAALHEMAGVYVTRGDLDGAMSLYQQALHIDEGLGDLQGKIRTLANMANILENNGEAERALGLYKQALSLSQQINEPFAVANVLRMMSSSLTAQGKKKEVIAGLIEIF